MGMGLKMSGDNSSKAMNTVVDVESMRIFFNHVFRTASAMVLGAMLATYLTWGHVEQSRAIIWLLVFISFMVASTGWILYQIRSVSETVISSDESFWKNIRLIANLVGLLWMIGEFVLYVPDSLLHQLLLMVVTVLLISAGSYATMSICPRMFLALAVPSALPFAINFIHAGDAIHLVLAVMFTLAVAYNVWIGMQFNRFLEDTRIARHRADVLAVQLAEQKGIAEQANRAKSVFLAAAGHDLRQPVHALGFLLENLRGRTQGAEDVLDLMQSSTDTMRGLLESLLDISKLDAGVVTPVICGFSLDELLDRVRKNFLSMANDKGLELEIQPTKLVVQSDPNLLYSIVANLVANAIKYTNKGKVSILCSKLDNEARIDVIDTGPGIPEDEQHNVFREYYQLNKTQTERSHGLGLGLAIVDRLVKLLGGHSIKLDSSQAKGTCVSINLPTSSSASFSWFNAAQNVAVEFSGINVLVVDNEPAIRVSLAQLLKKWGCIVTAAASVDEAENLISRNTRPDLIISDVNLRRSNDGLRFVENLRQIGLADTAYLLITGETNAESLISIRNSGLNVLSKPVAPARLRLVMASVLKTGMKAAA